MDELKTYKEWCPQLEEEWDMHIVDDDGALQLNRQGRLNAPMSKTEASSYFMQCTVEGSASNILEASKNTKVAAVSSSGVLRGV